jgi:hypothetical protein
MILCEYAVRDVASNVFRMNFKRPERVDGRGEIFHAEAIRYFADGVKAEKSELHAHPSDFELFYLGTFDDLTGRFENLDVPVRISRGTDHIES